MGVTIRWQSGGGPDPAIANGIAALCASYPGPSPVSVEWSDNGGEMVQMRSRRLQVDLNEDFLLALRDLVGTDLVALVKAR